jgi:hypothetical protein
MTPNEITVVANLINMARGWHKTRDAKDALDAVSNMLAGAFSVNNTELDIEQFRKDAGAIH